MLRLAPALGLLAVLFPPLLTAQAPFRRFTGQVIPDLVPDPGRPASGDVDGDGDLDLFVPSRTGQDQLFLNDGDGVFTEATDRLPVEPRPTRGAHLVDVDADGDLDLILAGDTDGPFGDKSDRLWFNDGAGRFTDVSATHLPPDHLGTEKHVVCDVDGDGDVDLIAMNSWESANFRVPNRVYRNDGTGRFTDVTGASVPAEDLYSADMQAGDLDGDGDLDLVLSIRDLGAPPLRIYDNDGAGRFSLAGPGRLPSLRETGFEVRLFDLDGDGDLDVVADSGYRLTALVNDGQGRFADESVSRLPGPRIVMLKRAADLDGDGDIDLTVVDGDRALLLRNENQGVFSGSLEIPSSGDLAADFDGDLDLDLLVLSAPDVLRNDGSGTQFRGARSEPRGPALQGQPWRSALADVDGDGDLDAWIGTDEPQQDRLLINDGRGSFVAAWPQPPRGGRSASVVVFGDVDGDGDQDALLGDQRDENWTRLLLGDGRGGFTDVTFSHMPRFRGPTTELLLRDFDGDGDLDLLEINFADNAVLMTNDGSGRFTLAALSAFGNWRPPAAGTAAFDADGDGDLDVALAVVNQPVLLFLNVGRPRFERAPAGSIPDLWLFGQDLVARDFDGDGDDDLAAIGLAGCPRLYLNDGVGVFVDATAGRLPDSLPSSLLEAMDHDLDGDVDLVAWDPGRCVVLSNDGRAHFTIVQELDPAGAPVAVGDLDGDLDPDLLLGVADGPVRVVNALRREIAVARPARIGRSLEFEVHAAGRAPGPAFAWNFLAVAPSQLELPGLGRLGLDSADLLQGPTVFFGFTDPVASARMTVPADPALVGAELFVQGLLSDAGGPRLTNTTRFVIHD